MGAADLVPGVSGSTIAYVLGIYPRFVAALSALGPDLLSALWRGDQRRLREAELGFLLLLALGIALAVAFLLWGLRLHERIQARPAVFYGLFWGLVGGTVLASLTRYFADLRDESAAARLHPARAATVLLFGIAAGALLFAPLGGPLPHGPGYLVLWGLAAIGVMLLPGVSGSYVLVLLGQYEFVLGGIAAFDFYVILPFGAGALAGLFLFSRLYHRLLDRHAELAVAFIDGLLLTSLVWIWPFRNVYDLEEGLLAGTLLGCGLALSLWLQLRAASGRRIRY